MSKHLQEIVAEAFGTFLLVFIGCGAIVVNALHEGALGHVGISFAFGLAVMIGIYAVGNISGAHFNPAVTLGFCAAGRLRWRSAPWFIMAQLVGALLASVVHRYLLATTVTDLGATLPAEGASLVQVFLLEVLLTFLLMTVILNVSTGHMEKGIMAGVAVGGMIAVAALVGGPISGASMNPARSLAPALASGNLAAVWIYVVAPPVGAFLASPLCRIIQGKDCCEANQAEATS